MKESAGNVLFLYSEVAGYFLACAEALHQRYGVSVHIVRWPVNPEAPFRFRDYAGVVFHERRDLDDRQLYALYERLAPQWVYVSGWMDPAYLRLARRIRREGGCPVVGAGDNAWQGSLRQRLGALASPFYVLPSFDYFLIPGLPQYEFARRLGFRREQILTGMYSADTAPFWEAGEHFHAQAGGDFPRRLLYVGRYVEIKGVQELCEAFAEVQGDFPGWELQLYGAGPLRERLPAHPAIAYAGFVQPDQLPALAAQGGCFVLPSRTEPWGVVLHEFAAAGFPLLASDACGAASAFLRPGYNGFRFRAGDKASLRASLRSLMALPGGQLWEMGRRSRQLSYQLSPGIWAANLMQLTDRQ